MHELALSSLARDADLGNLRIAFADVPVLTFGQAWLDRPEPDLAGGEVRVACDGTGLTILAQLEDRDIRTAATAPNQPLWALGDALEVFLRPPGAEAYWEFHVAPNNLRLRLKFPHRRAVYDRKRAIGPDAPPEAIIEPFLLAKDFESRVWRDAEKGAWSVFARFPFDLFDRPPPLASEVWLASFCRYDYAADRDTPVLSSTSPLIRPDFHDQTAWVDLQVCGS